MSDQDMAYGARYPCGCIGAVTLDSKDPVRRKDIAKNTSEWIEDGATIVHTTVAELRPQIKDCPHKPKWGQA